MDDVTDVVFRQVVARAAVPDVFMTEFASTDGFLSPGRHAVEKRLRLEERPAAPVVVQIWGSDPEKYLAMAREMQTRGFAGIDINFGCPEKGIVARGCCGGMIGQYERAAEIISATKEGAGKLPVSVKTRVGLRTQITEEWAGFLLRQDIAALTIHARTVSEMSRVPARWEEVAKVVSLRNDLAPHTLVIGNGDVRDRAHGLQLSRETGADGIMIGRGIFHDLWAFAESPEEHSPQERLEILAAHLESFEREWQGAKPFPILKKFFKVYVQGWPGAAELRARLMDARNGDEVREILAQVSAPAGQPA